MLPSRVHAIVLVSKLHKPTLRALAYARATRPTSSRRSPSTSTPRTPRRCATSGTRRDIPVPLKVLASPYREITRPIIDYVQSLRTREPARRRHRLHPRVRGRPLVGAAPAQPERAAAQGPAAVHPGRDGHQRAVAAGARPRVRTGPSDFDGPVVGSRRAEARADGRPAARRAPRRSSRSARSPTAGTASPGSTVGVVFVRHALPGERVRVAHHRGRRRQPVPARPTRSRSSMPPRSGSRRRARMRVRGGAAAATSSTPTWPTSGSSRPRWSREQFQRLAHLDVEVTVEALPGDDSGLRWRSRVEFAVDADGRAGLRQHRSHAILPVADCLIADQRIIDSGVLDTVWTGCTGVDAVAADQPADAVLVALPDGRSATVVQRVETPEWSGEFRIGARGFWQVHPGAAPTFVAHVLDDAPAAGGGEGPRPVCGCRPLRGGPRGRGRPVRFGARRRGSPPRRGRRDAQHRVPAAGRVAPRARRPGGPSAGPATDPHRPGRPRPAADRRRPRRDPRHRGPAVRAGSPTSRATRPLWRGTSHTWLRPGTGSRRCARSTPSR